MRPREQASVSACVCASVRECVCASVRASCLHACLCVLCCCVRGRARAASCMHRGCAAFSNARVRTSAHRARCFRKQPHRHGIYGCIAAREDGERRRRGAPRAGGQNSHGLGESCCALQRCSMPSMRLSRLARRVGRMCIRMRARMSGACALTCVRAGTVTRPARAHTDMPPLRICTAPKQRAHTAHAWKSERSDDAEPSSASSFAGDCASFAVLLRRHATKGGKGPKKRRQQAKKRRSGICETVPRIHELRLPFCR